MATIVYPFLTVITLTIMLICVAWFYHYRQLSNLIVIGITLVAAFDNFTISLGGFFSSEQDFLITMNKLRVLLRFIAFPFIVPLLVSQARLAGVDWANEIRTKLLAAIIFLILLVLGLKEFFALEINTFYYRGIIRYSPGNLKVVALIGFSIIIGSLITGVSIRNNHPGNHGLMTTSVIALTGMLAVVTLPQAAGWYIISFVETLYLFGLLVSEIYTQYMWFKKHE